MCADRSQTRGSRREQRVSRGCHISLHRTKSRKLGVLLLGPLLAAVGCSDEDGFDSAAVAPDPAASATTAPAAPTPSPSTTPVVPVDSMTDEVVDPTPVDSPAAGGTSSMAAGGSGGSESTAGSGGQPSMMNGGSGGMGAGGDDSGSGGAPVLPPEPPELMNLTPEQEMVLALGELVEPPVIRDLDGTPTSLQAGDFRQIYYDVLPYEGNDTRAHAWVGIPDGVPTPMPAVVLVHGGGGRAFSAWVEQWNDRGYAAIAMGLEGQDDDDNIHDWPGPERAGIYGDWRKPLQDQWMYHAVADVVLANSLMRSLPEVNENEVGVMGVSWGGIITSTVMGIDTRFRFAIPVYGCGNLHLLSNHYSGTVNTNYEAVWNPLIYLPRAVMPAMWFSWPGDIHFFLDVQATTYRGTPGERTVTLIPGMGHGHGAAWNRPHGYEFADSVLSEGSSWIKQVGLVENGSNVEVTFESRRPLRNGVLISTTDDGPTDEATFRETTASLVDNGNGTWTASVALPNGTHGWFINVHVDDELLASSDYELTAD